MKLKKGLIPLAALVLITSNIYNVDAKNNYDDKIHFLPVGSGDAILIESNGKFALVDGGEDSDNPRGFKDLENAGYEKVVVDYIKKVAGDKNGKVTLEWIVGTHAHSDHLGGLDTVVKDEDIYVKKGYLKVYDESKIRLSEVNDWDNKEVYEQLVDALKNEKGSERISKIPTTPFNFGDLTIQFYNTEDNSTKENGERKGENENSLGLLVSKNDQKVFLAGDINNLDGDEDLVGEQLGKINLLKLGHHGYAGSSSLDFLNKLSPEYSIATNFDTNINHKISKDLDSIKTKVYSTMENNGVIATFDKDDFGLSEYKQGRKWVFENDKWYFKNETSNNVKEKNTKNYAKGWAKLNWEDKSNWYYFDKDGAMQTGWIQLEGKWYYLNEQSDDKGYRGAMLTGWQQLNYKNKMAWYYFDENGAMQTGWQKIKYENKTDWYYFDKSGAMQTGWIQLEGKWYYLNEKTDSKGYHGAMLTGTHNLKWKGKTSRYTFNSSGELIQ